MRVYWFFIPLFAIYLSIPLLSAVRDNLKIEVFTYIGIITFFLASLLPTLAKLTNMHYNIGISPSVSAGYLLYVFLGYIISKKEISRNKRYIFYLVSLVGWYIHFEGSNILSLQEGKIIGTFKGYINFPAVMQAIGIFIAFKYIPWNKIFKSEISINWINRLSQYTFGIYLIHMYFVIFIPKIFEFSSSSILWRTVGALIVFFLCTLVCHVISKIPIFRKTIGL